jgi:CheY-like chemotaxis protein
MAAGSSEPVVLVADDDEDILELACLQLADAGYRVIRAGDGDEALRIAREELPDACVFDVIMPGLHGHEVLGELRDDEATAEIPVMLVTATLEQRALWRLGPRPDDCMQKQDLGAELEDRVGALLAQRVSLDAAEPAGELA